MKLSTLASDLPHRRAGGPGDPDILTVTHDSRAARTGSLFAAFPGLKSDGRRFVADAVSRGAVAALGLAPAPDATAVPYLEVENPRRSAGLVASRLAGRPSERLAMAGCDRHERQDDDDVPPRRPSRSPPSEARFLRHDRLPRRRVGDSGAAHDAGGHGAAADARGARRGRRHGRDPRVLLACPRPRAPRGLLLRRRGLPEPLA